jgi:hypothetical protein
MFVVAVRMIYGWPIAAGDRGAKEKERGDSNPAGLATEDRLQVY